MASPRPLIGALTAIYLAFAGLILVEVPGLPDRVATHFGPDGVADGWMARSAFAGFSLLFPIGLSIMIAGPLYVTRFVPEGTINLPNKAHWLAPERRAATFDRMFALGLGLACLTMLLMLGLHALLIRANRAQPPRLPTSPAFGLLAAYLAGVAAFVWQAGWRAWRVGPSDDRG